MKKRISFIKTINFYLITLKNNQGNLQVARDDLQELRLENMNLKNRLDELERRNEELYAQVNAMV